MLKKLGFWKRFQDPMHEQFRTVIKMFGALAYCPVDQVQAAYDALSRYATNLYPDITSYTEYFTRTWIGPPGSGGGRYKLNFWNIREA